MASSVEVTGARPRATRVHPVAARSRRRGGFLGGRIEGSPWIQRDLLRLVLWQVIGAVGITITWFGSSGEVVFRDQAIWTAFAVLAAAVAAAGGANWLLTGLSAVARERRLLRQEIADLYGFTAPDTVAGDLAQESAPVFVTAAGMRRYHRPSCDVVRGKDTRDIVSGAENLQPCGMCRS